jgi:hypothetical protein
MSMADRLSGLLGVRIQCRLGPAVKYLLGIRRGGEQNDMAGQG